MITTSSKKNLTKKQIKSIFLPKVIDDNPYIKQLKLHLKKLDIELVFPDTSSSRTLFLSTVFFPQKADIIHLHWLHKTFVKVHLTKAVHLVH
ncbi:hypothetical protein VF10_05940, partial [Nostoc linckia z13]